MQRNHRTDLIEKLQAERTSKVLTYITSDRPPPLSAQIAGDTIKLFYEHLRKIGKVEKIDLFLYSQGGDTITPWRLVNLLREFCNTLAVLVPFKAHSAATLIALGADEIVMTPLGELSPIDPSIGGPFNPPHPENPNVKLPVEVEDVTGYINLAKEKMGITDQDNLVRVFEKLVDSKVHPLALGAVYRSLSLIRILAERMLKLHMKEKEDVQRIPQIVSNFVERLYYHGYLINRNEAEDLGLRIIKPANKLEDLMWQLYLEYEKEIGLGKPFIPLEYLGKDKDSVERVTPIALIESTYLSSGFFKQIKIKKTVPPAGPPQFEAQVNDLGWRTTKIKEE